MTVYLRPIPLTDPADLPGALPLAGGWTRFTHVERLERGRALEVLPASALDPERLARLTAPRPPMAGLRFDRPRLMGILNVTPDSFSDGGQHDAPAAACARVEAMRDEGADLIDIGGESTRPGAAETPAETEIARITPVLKALRASGFDLPISLDTRKAEVARAGCAAGANILNDVSGLRFDPALADVAAATNTPLIVMHSLGTPETMQDLAPGAYTDPLLDIYDALAATLAQAEAAGIPRTHLAIDPGIGFGKTDPQQLALIRRISLFHGLGVPILLGVSRKGLIGRIGGEAAPARRGPGSAGIGLWAIAQGIQMLRVHDIAMHAQAIRLWQAGAGLFRPAHDSDKTTPNG